MGSPPLLIIMLKEPVMGQVKTRLAREIGAVSATGFARVAARSLIGRLSRDKRWRTVLAVAPDRAVASRFWPRHRPRLPQGRGDLGARMGRLLAPPRRPAVLIGADIPGVSGAIIARAFGLLRRHEAIVGPAEDGGYWLIGLNRFAPRRGLFQGVRWSTPFALEDTLAGLGGVTVGMAARLGDVDDAESHQRLGPLAGRLILPVSSRAGG